MAYTWTACTCAAIVGVHLRGHRPSVPPPWSCACPVAVVHLRVRRGRVSTREPIRLGRPLKNPCQPCEPHDVNSNPPPPSTFRQPDNGHGRRLPRSASRPNLTAARPGEGTIGGAETGWGIRLGFAPGWPVQNLICMGKFMNPAGIQGRIRVSAPASTRPTWPSCPCIAPRRPARAPGRRAPGRRAPPGRAPGRRALPWCTWTAYTSWVCTCRACT